MSQRTNTVHGACGGGDGGGVGGVRASAAISRPGHGLPRDCGADGTGSSRAKPALPPFAVAGIDADVDIACRADRASGCKAAANEPNGREQHGGAAQREEATCRCYAVRRGVGSGGGNVAGEAASHAAGGVDGHLYAGVVEVAFQGVESKL